jgi:ABC-type dipeptide/oligopeptide/nickel transport system permease component
VLYTLPVIWLVVSLVFLLIHLVPGDPIAQMLGEGAPAADLQAARHAYGLDLPLGQQYFNYWKGALHGDLGTSFRYNQSVTKLLLQRYPYTLQLTIAALSVAILLSIPAGVHSARTRNALDDRAISVVSLFGLSFDQGWMATGFRCGQLCEPGVAGDHDGQRAGGDPDAHGADVNARRTQPGLHSHRAREGAQ